MTIYVRAADGQFLCINDPSWIHFEPAHKFLCINDPSWIHFEPAHNILTIAKDTKVFKLIDPNIDMMHEDPEGIYDIVRMCRQESVLDLRVEKLNLFER